jgi:hypothetical protein
VDSLLEGGGFEPPVPRQRRHPSATANHLASYHFPRKLGLRFAPKASTPSRKSSEPRRPVFKIELKRGGGYRATPDPDPVYLCTDDVIGILPERKLNNGQPSLHAGVDRRRAAAGGACRACRRRGRLLHGDSRGAGRRYGEGGRRSNSMASSPPGLRRIWCRRSMPAWCTAMAHESCSNPSTSSMSMPARRGPRMHGSTG